MHFGCTFLLMIFSRFNKPRCTFQLCWGSPLNLIGWDFIGSGRSTPMLSKYGSLGPLVLLRRLRAFPWWLPAIRNFGRLQNAAFFSIFLRDRHIQIDLSALGRLSFGNQYE